MKQDWENPPLSPWGLMRGNTTSLPRQCKTFPRKETANSRTTSLVVFPDVPCIDSTRVLLTFLRPEVGYGYIHANRIDYPTLKNKYIVTQSSSTSLHADKLVGLSLSSLSTAEDLRHFARVHFQVR
ncbi:hypothetical protein COOONC_04187 [Cooperia oncophora]